MAEGEQQRFPAGGGSRQVHPLGDDRFALVGANQLRIVALGQIPDVAAGRAEPGGEFGGREGGELAQGVQPQRFQAEDVVDRERQPADRHPGEESGGLLRRDDVRLAGGGVTGRHPGRELASADPGPGPQRRGNGCQQPGRCLGRRTQVALQAA